MAEALLLADELDGLPANDFYEALGDEAAAELRRLHAENERLSATVKAREDEILTHSEAFYEATRLLSEEREKNERLHAQRDALLEALKYIAKQFRQHGRQHWPEAVAARLAIEAVEGEKT